MLLHTVELKRKSGGKGLLSHVDFDYNSGVMSVIANKKRL